MSETWRSGIWIWSLNGCFPYSSFHYNLFGYTKVVTILYDWLRFSLVTRVLPVPLHRPPASGSISRAKVSFTRDLRQVSTNVRLCLQHLQGQENKIRNFFVSKCSDIHVWNFFPLVCDINLWDGALCPRLNESPLMRDNCMKEITISTATRQTTTRPQMTFAFTSRHLTDMWKFTDEQEAELKDT